MKKNIFILLVLMFFIGGLSAQTSLTLETVCKNLAARPNTTGDFTQTKSLQTNGRKLKSNGKFIISNSGILWRTEKPFPSSLILTKDAMVQIAANGTRSVMSGKDNQIFSNISGTLSSVFSGNVNELKKNFICDFSEDGKDGWKVSLTPKDSTIASVMNILVLSGKCDIKAGTAVLEKLEMAETSGNSILYEFVNQKYPEELSNEEKQNFVIE